MLLSLVGPYLPQPAQQFLQAFQPLINLLSNPAQLAWMAYNQPTQIPGILVQTLSNVFGLLRTIDLRSLTDNIGDLFSDPGSKSMGDWVPLIVSGLAIFLSFRTFLGTLRMATRFFSTAFRYGSLITLAFSLFTWVTNAMSGRNAGGNAPANGNGLGDIFSSLGNAVGGGQQAGFANMARGFAGEMADAWQKGQKESGKNRRSSSSSSSRKTKAAKAKAQSATEGTGDLADMAQNWVKEALFKAALGGGDDKKKAGTGKTRNR